MDPLFPSHMVPNPFLCTLPTISLVDPSSFSQLFQLPKRQGIDVSTHDMTIPPHTALNDHILNLHNNTQPITKNFNRHPINQSHPTHYPDHTTLHPTLPRLILNSKFHVSQQYKKNWSNTTLINLPRCFKDKPCFPTNILLNSLNFFQALPIFALTASDAPP